MHRKPGKFVLSVVAAGVMCGVVGWPGTTTEVVAKSATVPFRLMEATIRETQAALEAGTVTSEDLVEMYLARIDAYDENGPQLNSMIHMNPEALDAARALDAERRTHGSRGPLHGIPILLKDNYDTFDMPTTNSSLSFGHSIPPDDAYLVRRLREAGAVFVGKTNMHEFARGITTISSAGGQTLNPYDLRRNPGGSSGGTGAAVAANFGVVGMGSDTCGSIRIPSSHNSLVGLRTTQGLFSRDGIIPLALSQDVGGPLARSVEDIAIVLDLTAGFDPNDPVTAVSELHTPKTYTHFLKTGHLRGARFGLLLDALTADTDAEVADVIEAAKQELERLGATVVGVNVPNYNDISNPSVIGMEFKFNLEAYLAATPAAPLKTLQAIIDSGLFHPSLTNGLINSQAVAVLDTPEYRARLAGRETFKQALLTVLEENNLDALIYPTIRNKPVFVPITNQPGSNCRVSAHSGLPAISVPVGFTAMDGVPVGMEFLGRDFTEGELLQIAYSWEQATHVRRVPASTPDIEPEWSHLVTDGISSFELDAAGRRFRFTAPGADTFVYIDPQMHDVKGTIRGELKDSRWHIRYSIATGGSRLSTIWVNDLWHHEATHVLQARTIPQ
jgi:Asp-tRNA(Asn)/Glu-tRNA(Gln) amidotransferase A subunit family amidase